MTVVQVNETARESYFGLSTCYVKRLSGNGLLFMYWHVIIPVVLNPWHRTSWEDFRVSEEVFRTSWKFSEMPRSISELPEDFQNFLEDSGNVQEVLKLPGSSENFLENYFLEDQENLQEFMKYFRKSKNYQFICRIVTGSSENFPGTLVSSSAYWQLSEVLPENSGNL